MAGKRLLTIVLAALAVAACEPGGPDAELVFVDGRAVAPAFDSVYAYTALGVPGVLLHYRHTGATTSWGSEELSSPWHIQWMNDRWYVSDVDDGQPLVVVFTPDGVEERRISLSGIASAPHQFAVLPDGRIVVEATDDRLVALDGDSVVTFALVETEARTGLVTAARGGVLHAVPDGFVTLYNGLGNIRWRLEWPWDETIFAIDLAVDVRGRTHVLAGQQEQRSFIVFGFAPETGEVIRWSEEGSLATFLVGRLGEYYPDSASNWVGDRPDR